MVKKRIAYIDFCIREGSNAKTRNDLEKAKYYYNQASENIHDIMDEVKL